MDWDNAWRWIGKGNANGDVRQIHSPSVGVLQEVQENYAVERVAADPVDVLLVGVFPEQNIAAYWLSKGMVREPHFFQINNWED